jgi:hypothetical protein
MTVSSLPYPPEPPDPPEGRVIVEGLTWGEPADLRAPAGQSRRHSFYESLTNVAVGLIVSLTSQMILFPLHGIHVSTGTNLSLVAWFTAVSVARSYLLRRWWNRKTIAETSRR